jgi:hypothetical protein
LKEEIFNSYEKKVLEMLVSNNLLAVKLTDIFQDAEFVGYEYTGSGYFLTVRHPNLPENRIVCHKPEIIGEAENIECGFIVFLENKELTIECHSWGEIEIPENFREKNVELREIDESHINS